MDRRGFLATGASTLARIAGCTGGEAVASDAADRVHDDAVRADRKAHDAADVDAVPTLFCFRDGEFATRIEGAVGYGVVEAVMSD